MWGKRKETGCSIRLGTERERRETARERLHSSINAAEAARTQSLAYLAMFGCRRQAFFRADFYLPKETVVLLRQFSRIVRLGFIDKRRRQDGVLEGTTSPG